jgi:hypothetical protein
MFMDARLAIKTLFFFFFLAFTKGEGEGENYSKLHNMKESRAAQQIQWVKCNINLEIIVNELND